MELTIGTNSVGVTNSISCNNEKNGSIPVVGESQLTINACKIKNFVSHKGFIHTEEWKRPFGKQWQGHGGLGGAVNPHFCQGGARDFLKINKNIGMGRGQ